MEIVEELYDQRLRGQRQSHASQRLRQPQIDLDACRLARCPFMNATCDGGRNRDMARVSASEERLRPFFNDTVERTTGGYFPCGIC